MFTLYFSPGACSTASHITLEETGAAYEHKPILLANKEQLSEAYQKINPRMKVPALQLEDGSVITENTAILYYLGKKYPDAKLLPQDTLGEARCISFNAWLSNSVHPCFTHVARPERFTADEAGKDGVKTQGKASFWKALQEIDSHLAGKQFIHGSDYTCSDAYSLVFLGWGTRIELPVKELTNYQAMKDRALKRPAVRKVLEREDNVLLKS